MAKWKDENGSVHDDMDGAALTMSAWPTGLTKISDKEAYALQNPEKTAEQLAEEYRAKRDMLLTASDWTQVADAPVDQAAWKVYRQALRDIPEQKSFPANIVWPNQPE